MNKLDLIVRSTRGTGNTTWILKSAIAQPNCIIVSKTAHHAQCLKSEYFDLLSKQPWYRKLYWKMFGREHPIFKSINDFFEGDDCPVIFDNSALLSDDNLPYIKARRSGRSHPNINFRKTAKEFK